MQNSEFLVPDRMKISSQIHKYPKIIMTFFFKVSKFIKKEPFPPNHSCFSYFSLNFGRTPWRRNRIGYQGEKPRLEPPLAIQQELVLVWMMMMMMMKPRVLHVTNYRDRYF